MKTDRFWAPHYRYYVREMRILAYGQLLESYRSLTLDYMATSFGVSNEFIDRLVPNDLLSYSYRSFSNHQNLFNNSCFVFFSFSSQRVVEVHRRRAPSLQDRQGRRNRRDQPPGLEKLAVPGHDQAGRRAAQPYPKVEPRHQHLKRENTFPQLVSPVESILFLMPDILFILVSEWCVLSASRS